MDAEAATVDLLAARERPRSAAGRAACARGGASDASHLARVIPLTVDGLGPRGGKAHNPGEFVLADSLAQPRGGRARGRRRGAARLGVAAPSASDSSSRGRMQHEQLAAAGR